MKSMYLQHDCILNMLQFHNTGGFSMRSMYFHYDFNFVILNMLQFHTAL